MLAILMSRVSLAPMPAIRVRAMLATTIPSTYPQDPNPRETFEQPTMARKTVST